MLGKSLPDDQLALVMPIHAAVTDENAQQDRQPLFAIVLAPKKAIDEKMAKVVKHRKQAQLDSEKQHDGKSKADKLAREKQATVNSVSQRSAEGGLAVRIEALEKRSRRLEATLDSILDKLDKIEKNQAEK